MEFFGIEVTDTSARSEADAMLRFLEALRPQPSPVPLVRIGPGRDGSYLVPEDLEGVTACFSPGVANVKTFEDDLAKRYRIAAHLCDASSDIELLRTPLVEGLQTFEKLWLDVNDSEDAVSLDKWVAGHRPDPAEDLMLQMDIEGAEYRNILSASDKTLSRFRIFVVELHSLELIEHEGALREVLLPFIEKLQRQFTCVHAHANNVVAPIKFADLGISVPRLIELSFLRNDRFDGRELREPQLPHPEEIRYNVPDKPPNFLDDFFRGRPPSMAESFRMWTASSDFHMRRVKSRLNKLRRRAKVS